MDDAVRRFLARQRVAHLATADSSGDPHVVPICFVVSGETVYIAIDEKPKTTELMGLRRLRNIAENRRVAIVADVYDDEDWSRLGFVLLRADASLIDAGAPEHAAALKALRAKYPQYRAMALEGRPLIAARITRVTRWGRLEAP